MNRDESRKKKGTEERAKAFDLLTQSYKKAVERHVKSFEEDLKKKSSSNLEGPRNHSGK